MKTHSASVRTIDLGYEQLLVLDGGHDTRVRVLFGGTWLTEEGVGGDAFVRSGAEVALRGGGSALLEGLEPTRVQIVDARSRGFWQRAARRLQRAARSLRAMVERLQLGRRPAVEPNS